MNISKIEEYPLGDSDIKKILGDNINILSYPKLQEYNNIDDIFDNLGRCILLFLTENEYTGHWLCMHKDRYGAIHYFDPYGKGIDQSKKWLTRDKLAELDQDKPLLMNLLRKSGKEVYYNTHDFQIDREGINTCGRHCTVRLLFKDLDLNEYKDLIINTDLPPDEFVSIITFNIIKK
jgi:hypothetical protein